MGEHSSSSHSRSKDKDKDRKHRSSRDDSDRDSKRHRSSHHSSSKDKDRKSSSSHRSSSRKDKESDEDEWVEKAAPPPSFSSSLLSSTLPPPPVDTVGRFTPGQSTSSTSGRLEGLSKGAMTDGFGEGDVEDQGGPVGDLFSAMGTERKRREPKEKLDPTQMMGQSSRELNKAHWQGIPNDPSPASASAAAAPTTNSPAPGSSGSTWRMTKLRRTYETATEEDRPVEEVALERYGSLAAWEEAKEERRVLDEREDRRRGRRSMGGAGGSGQRSGQQTPTQEGRRFIFTDGAASSADEASRPASRGSFRRPGEAPPVLSRTPSTANSAGPSTPIPRVFTPPPVSRAPSTLAAPRATAPSGLSQSIVLDPDPTTTAPTKPILNQSELNRLQAKVLKARLMGSDKADELEKEYEAERQRAAEGPSVGEVHLGGGEPGEGTEGTRTEMMPTLDARGRLYDVGGAGEPEQVGDGKRKKAAKFTSHDPKTGDVINQGASDNVSLSELVRQERFSGGASSQKDMDAIMASRIAADGRFKNDLDYADENAEKLARGREKTVDKRKEFAVQDYAKHQRTLQNCLLCPALQSSSSLPRAPLVALGTRVFLALTEHEPLVEGHCRIVPREHGSSMLEVEEEGWEEVRNFMKTLMQYFADKGQGVVFFESAYNHFKGQRHTWIECVPVPFELFDVLPGYFAEAISSSEQEWSQHKKLIPFTPARPFRRSLVPNLPYFAVQFDYKGEKGYGHIVEGVDDAPTRDADGEEIRGEAGEQGGGEFPRWFATEIIGSLLDLPPRSWRKPRRLDARQNKELVAKFRVGYDKWDWTKQLAEMEAEGERREEGPARG